MMSIASFSRRSNGIVLALSVVCASQAGANAQPSLADAIKAGTPLIDLRLRYENVDQ